MFEQMVIGDWLAGIIRDGVTAFMAGRFSDLNSGIRVLMTSLLILSISFQGIAIMFGELVSTGRELLKTFVIAMFAVIITVPSLYQPWIVDTVYNLKDNLTSFVMIGDSSSSMYEAFSETNYRMFAHASNVLDIAGMTDFRLIAVAVAIFIIYGVYYCLFIGVTLFAELTIGILLLLGCVALPLAAFQTARGMAKSWVKAIAKYILMFVVIGFTVGLLNAISNVLINELMNEVYVSRSGGLSENAVNITSPVFGATLLVGVFGSYLLYQAMETAAELTGSTMSDGKAGITSIKNAASSTMNTLNTGYRLNRAASKHLVK